MTDDKRKEIRINIKRPIKITTCSGSSYKAKMINLSISGVAIEFDAPGDKGTKLKLEFKLPFGSTFEIINANGVIMHNHFRNNKYIIGVKFEEIEEELLSQIAKYIAQVKDVRNRGIIS